jgi:cobalt-zinc-cadmium efflux system outer membrane protein
VSQSQEQLASAEKSVTAEVNRCHRMGESSLAEAPRTAVALASARQERDTVERSYEAGKVGVDDLGNARRVHEELERRYVDLLAKHRRSVLELNSAVGLRIMP